MSLVLNEVMPGKRSTAEYWLGHKHPDVRMRPYPGPGSNDSRSKSKAPQAAPDYASHREKLIKFLKSVADSGDNDGAALSSRIFLPSAMWTTCSSFEELDSKSIKVIYNRAEALLKIANSEKDCEKRIKGSIKQQIPKFRVQKSPKKSDQVSILSLSRAGTRASSLDDSWDLQSPVSSGILTPTSVRSNGAGLLTSRLRSFKLGSSQRKNSPSQTTPPLDLDDACSTFSYGTSEASSLAPASPPLEDASAKSPERIPERQDEGSWPMSLRKLDSHTSTSSMSSLSVPKGISKKPFPKLSLLTRRSSGGSSSFFSPKRTDSLAESTSPDSPPIISSTQAALDFYLHAVKTLHSSFVNSTSPEDEQKWQSIGPVWQEMLSVLIDDIFAILRAHWNRTASTASFC